MFLKCLLLKAYGVGSRYYPLSAGSRWQSRGRTRVLTPKPSCKVPGVLGKRSFPAWSCRDRARTQTAQPGCHRLKSQTPLWPPHAPGRDVRGSGRGPRLIRGSPAAHPRVIRGSWRTHRPLAGLLSRQGVRAAGQWRPRPGVKGVPKTRGKERNWKIGAQAEEKGDREGSPRSRPRLRQLRLRRSEPRWPGRTESRLADLRRDVQDAESALSDLSYEV